MRIGVIIGWICLVILSCGAVLGIIFLTLHTTMTVPIRFTTSYNIGNQLMDYAGDMYAAFSHHKDFRCLIWQISSLGKRGLIVNHLPRHIPLKSADFSDDLGFGAAIFRRNWLNQWHNPSIWSSIRTPLMRELDLAMLAMGVPLNPQDARHAATLHFRCSDVPFIRNPEYGLAYWRWWTRALALMPSTVERVVILWCFQHQAASKNAAAAEAYFNRFREHVESCVSIPVEQRCGATPETDFQFMRRSEFLVSASSSFSFMAAVTGSQTQAVIMKARDRDIREKIHPQSGKPVSWPDHITVLPRDMLKHTDVGDYLDVDSVCGQLNALQRT
jgi:hypothetical protein